MRLYSCKILLGGSRDNEVRKDAVTAAEVMVLRTLHGADSVLDIQPGKMDKRSHSDERKRLVALYVGVQDGTDFTGFQKTRAEMLNSLFGPAHNPLPLELAPDVVEVDDEVEPPRVRRTVVSGKAENVAAALE